MTQANLQAFALSKGIDANVQSMTEAQKVSLRYAYIPDKTKNAQGDFARTGGGAANQMRIFQETLKELGETFGQQLLPAFTDILKHVNSLLQQFGALDDQTKNHRGYGRIGCCCRPVVTIFGKLLPLLVQTAVYFKGIGSGAVSSTNWIVALSVAVASLERGLAKLVSNQRDKGGIIGFFQKMALSAFGTSEEIGKFVANTVTMQGQLSRGGGFAQMIGYQTKTRGLPIRVPLRPMNLRMLLNHFRLNSLALVKGRRT